MLCILMHKDSQVACLDLHSELGYVEKVKDIYDLSLMPIGTVINNAVDRTELNNWFGDRSIPMGRRYVKDLLSRLKLRTPMALATKCYGLSLSDHYWLCPANIKLEWSYINLFDNAFSDDIGKVLNGYKVPKAALNCYSSDLTTGGELTKRWIIKDNKRYLLKSGSGSEKQEVLNEVLASVLMTALDIPHVDYNLLFVDNKPYSVCPLITDLDTEMISARYVINTLKYRGSGSHYEHYINCCNALNVPNIISSVDKMLVLDYIIGNIDRHYNNFGIIRNSNTLNAISATPIYDSGASFGFDLTTSEIISNTKIKSKPFRSDPLKQLQLVTSFDWLNLSVLENVRTTLMGTIEKAGFPIEAKRVNAIVTACQKRANTVIRLARSRTT